MTGRTVRRARCRDKAAVINRMQRIPVRAVTRCTVAASTEVLAIRAVRRYSATVCIMTRSTSIMRLRIRAYQRLRICMTRRTVSRICLHQRTMIYRCMRRLPTRVMTRLTVAWCTEVFSARFVDQGASRRVMAVGAVGKMRVC